MQDLLKSFCFSDRKTGLLLVDLPTGTGKTYNAIDFIYKNYKNVNNKIIFITNLKKNLPINELRELFERDNRLKDFESDVLFIDNNVDTLIDNFDKVEKKIPYDLFNKNGTIINVKRCIKIIVTLKENLKNNKAINKEEFVSKENMYFMINQAREDLKDKYEKELRDVIEEALRFDGEGKKRTKAQKLSLIKDDPNYNWISILNPAVFTDDKKIIFMSIDKFLVRNSTIIEPSYNFLDNLSLLNNSIIFIDEFDSSKEIILKTLINDSINTKVNLIELFRVIYAGLENTSFSKLLTEVSSELKNEIEKNKKNYYIPNEIIEEFKIRAKEIAEKYNLVNFHKLETTEKERASFLFQDYKFHTVLDDENKCIFIDSDK